MSFPGETRVIKLYSPVSLDNGVVIDKVTMREPLVRDRITFMPKTAATKKRKKPA
jgi:hypothetical protein